ncbi:hypothetical protein HY636_03330 [Candidatus Woesearchaeota archaeon]|nr:hypothetical protein [Candidatus Woesearchaeota archaeon]
MAIAHENTQSQTLVSQIAGLTHVHIKGPGDDSLGDGLDDGLDALIRGYTARKPDERRKIKVEPSSKTVSVLKKFHKALKLNRKVYYNSMFKGHLEKTLTEVLTPDEIGIVFQAMLYETENIPVIIYDHDLTSQRIGIFTTQLIQNSYDSGYNNFNLVAENSQRIISHIGYRLNGDRLNEDKKRLAKIKIHGEVTDLCEDSQYFEVDVDGCVNSTGTGVGKYSRNGIITLRSKTQHTIDYSGNNITYKTFNKETLRRIIICALYDINACYYNAYNHVVFIKPNGEEEAVLKRVHNRDRSVLVNQIYYKFVEQVWGERGLKGLRARRVSKLNIP